MEKPFQAYAGRDPYVFVCYAHEDDGDVYAEIVGGPEPIDTMTAMGT